MPHVGAGTRIPTTPSLLPPPISLMSVLCEPFAYAYIRWISFVRILNLIGVTLAAPLSREVGDGFLIWLGNSS
jgi:hypothetical protein